MNWVTIYVKECMICTVNVIWAIVWDKYVGCAIFDNEWISVCIVIVCDPLSCMEPNVIATNYLVSEMLIPLLSTREWLNDYKSIWLEQLYEVNGCEACIWIKTNFELWLWVAIKMMIMAYFPIPYVFINLS